MSEKLEGFSRNFSGAICIAEEVEMSHFLKEIMNFRQESALFEGMYENLSNFISIIVSDIYLALHSAILYLRLHLLPSLEMEERLFTKW